MATCKECFHYFACVDILKSSFKINRQKAEIERLKAEADQIAEDYSNLIIKKDELFDEAEKLIKTAKAEAIKEFAYKLKNIPSVVVHKWEIDELVKEMVRGRLTMSTGISGLYQNTKGAKIARGEKVTQTNYERIKAMSIDELADMLMCPAEYGEFNRAEDCNADMSKNCNECIKRWLEKECEE